MEPVAKGRDRSLSGDCGHRVRQTFGWRLSLRGEIVVWVEPVAIGKDRRLGGDCG